MKPFKLPLYLNLTILSTILPAFVKIPARMGRPPRKAKATEEQGLLLEEDEDEDEDESDEEGIEVGYQGGTQHVAPDNNNVKWGDDDDSLPHIPHLTPEAPHLDDPKVQMAHFTFEATIQDSQRFASTWASLQEGKVDGGDHPGVINGGPVVGKPVTPSTSTTLKTADPSARMTVNPLLPLQLEVKQVVTLEGKESVSGLCWAAWIDSFWFWFATDLDNYWPDPKGLIANTHDTSK